MSSSARAIRRFRAPLSLRVTGVVWIALWMLPSTAAAQSVWELTPYKVQVLLAAGAGPGLSGRVADDVRREILDRAHCVIGGAWQLSVEQASPDLSARMLYDFDRLSADDLPSGWKELDKVILLSLAGGFDGYRIRAKEWDVRSWLWGSSESIDVRQPSRLPRDAFALVVQCFSPLATVEAVENDVATLRLRAAQLAPRDSSHQWTRPGDLFRAVVRYNNRDGTLRGQPQEIPWTVLPVESVDRGQVECRVVSGLRSPLSSRRRGRVEQLALAVHPPRESTRLTLRARLAPQRPLPGYDVISLSADLAQAERLGRTDSAGQLDVPPGADPFRVLLVKSGSELLARLPMVPGLSPELVADVPDDALRLEVEGFVTGLQENLVDLVARREVLVARARARLEANKLDEARKLLEELRSLRTREQFAQILRQQRSRFSTADRTVQTKIDKLFTDTEELLGRYLDPADISRLDADVRAAERSATSG